MRSGESQSQQKHTGGDEQNCQHTDHCECVSLGDHHFCVAHLLFHFKIYILLVIIEANPQILKQHNTTHTERARAHNNNI